MQQAIALAGRQMMERDSGWRSLPFPAQAVLHARRLKHSGTDCPFCRLGWAVECPAHPQ